MPIVSEFCGIKISMYSEANGKHHIPHVHARVQDEEASVSLDGDVITGTIRGNKLRLVQAWLILRQKEVEENWKRAEAGEKLLKIEPLK